MEKFYQKLRKAAAVTAVAGAAALGGYFHPVPIVRNWGDIAARDMAAKAEIAQDIKGNLAKYSEDGVWNAKELIYVAAETDPRRFIEHRTEDMRPKLLGATYFDSLHPKHALEDELWRVYNYLFSDGTKRGEKGEFASYHEIRNALFREMNKMVANKDRATLHRAKGESNEEFVFRHFDGSLDLNQTQLNGQLYAELDKIEAYFSSEENQRALRLIVEPLGDARDRLYNALLFGVFGAVGVAGVLAGSEYDARRRSRQAEEAEMLANMRRQIAEETGRQTVLKQAVETIETRQYSTEQTLTDMQKRLDALEKGKRRKIS
ncbi:MAG: hypothetical protein HYU56_01440 [Candidatus Aenigmarchaeota archaeon]|nr:hypothetical protein [Candidatus Aenigmarchaeota archaeon]